MSDKGMKPTPESTPGNVGQVHAKVAPANPKGMDPNYRSDNRGKGMK